MFETVVVSGACAVEELMRFRTDFAASGRYPFLIGGSEALAQFSEQIEFDDRPLEEILESAAQLAATEWLAARRAEMQADGFDLAGIEGAWPDEISGKGRLAVHRDIGTGELRDEVILGLARIAEPWQLPAVLRLGGWNDCPEPEIQCAVMKRWQDQYGAEIVGVSGDVVECLVERPPANREAALELAWEQYLFCYDLVEQGCGTIANLAATLLDSDYWYFWWD